MSNVFSELQLLSKIMEISRNSARMFLLYNSLLTIWVALISLNVHIAQQSPSQQKSFFFRSQSCWISACLTQWVCFTFHNSVLPLFFLGKHCKLQRPLKQYLSIPLTAVPLCLPIHQPDGIIISAFFGTLTCHSSGLHLLQN